MKHITLRTADGEALITYSGMGTVEDDVHLSERLRRLLRNENRTLDQVLTLIQEWATHKWGGPLLAHNRPHAFLVGAFTHGRPRAVEITNIRPADWSVQDRFTVEEYPTPQILVRGMGARAISAEDWELLDRITQRQPKRPKGYMRVLAGVHRRAQQSGLPGSETISQTCMTTSMPPNYGTAETGDLEQLVHWPTPDAASLPPVPLLVMGLDMTAVYEASHLISPFMEAGEAPPQEALDHWSEAIRRGMFAPPDP